MSHRSAIQTICQLRITKTETKRNKCDTEIIKHFIEDDHILQQQLIFIPKKF